MKLDYDIICRTRQGSGVEPEGVVLRREISFILGLRLALDLQPPSPRLGMSLAHRLDAAPRLTSGAIDHCSVHFSIFRTLEYTLLA